MKFKRIFIVVLDSVGIGNAKDAEHYKDKGSNTLLHIDTSVGGLKLLNLEKIGLGYLDNYMGIKKIKPFSGYIGRLEEKSNGKDTMTGHWEIMGLQTKVPFVTFTDNGFPEELINELQQKTGRKIIGNYAASGTEILKDLGEEHMKTGNLIVYTSADSVLQICGHEDYLPLSELYRYCEIAREITMKDEWKVGRIIARPFIGKDKNSFVRTPNRHDYALSPFNKTYLDYLKEKGLDVISIGKINDIFNSQGISEAYKSKSNSDGMNQTIQMAKEKNFNGLCFVNLVDFDMEYGHRRDPIGYGKSIEEFDEKLGILVDSLKEDDLLILTADHGNDPTWYGSDHTREEIPFILYSKAFKEGKLLDKGDTFADIGATVAANFGIIVPDLLGKNRL